VYVFAVYVGGMGYSSVAWPSITCTCIGFCLLSFSVMPCSLNITLSLFIQSLLASSTFALSVIVCPALAVMVVGSSVMFAFSCVMFSISVCLVLLDV
jgi:hypothetical protein